MQRSFLPVQLMVVALALSACAGLPGSEPLQVSVAGIESQPGEGLEMRMLVKLRVQNPNDAPVDYNGVYVKLDVLDKTFATGVSDEQGSIPRFGESVIQVPVTLSTLRAALYSVNFIMGGGSVDKVRYTLSGKLNGSAFSSMSFKADGELALPKP